MKAGGEMPPQAMRFACCCSKRGSKLYGDSEQIREKLKKFSMSRDLLQRILKWRNRCIFFSKSCIKYEY
jgi:hypothetical protein